MRIIVTAFVFSVSALFIYSCKKSGTTDSGSFTWTWNGANYTGNYKEAFIASLGSGSLIVSGTGPESHTAGTGPRISVSSLNAGTYTLGSGMPNYIQFIDPNGNVLSSTTGTLTISSNSNNKLSGSFSGTLINATSQTTSINGSFSNIKISP